MIRKNNNIQSPKGTLPKTDRVKTVQEYLTSCGMTPQVIWGSDDLREIVAHVEDYFGRFIGIEITTRNAVQNIVMSADAIVRLNKAQAEEKDDNTRKGNRNYQRNRT